MTFQRNAKIFRGRLDAAPLAGVFFLLIIFMLLASLVYTPGIPIGLSANAGGASRPGKEISLAKNGTVVFEKKTYATNGLEQLREDLKRLPPRTTLVLRSAPNAPRETIERIRDMARILELNLETTGASIELPVSQNVIGTTNRTVVVAINIAGQYFFENQLISETKLKSQLTAEVQKTSSPLTLVVLADKGVEYDSIVHLAQLAEESGIQQALLQQRPSAKTTR